jgi:hypothetical protein
MKFINSNTLLLTYTTLFALLVRIVEPQKAPLSLSGIFSSNCRDYVIETECTAN